MNGHVGEPSLSSGVLLETITQKGRCVMRNSSHEHFDEQPFF